MDGVGALGYAITQTSARSLLSQLGLKPIEAGLDLLLRDYCQGFSPMGWKPKGPRRCLGVSPPLFAVHWRAGPLSSDSDHFDALDGEDERRTAFTKNIRWSVKMNMEELVDGGTSLVDQYPDDD